MEISVISFTRSGQNLSKTIKEKLTTSKVLLFTKWTGSTGENRVVPFVKVSISDWAKEQMEQRRALVFIGACGIAVRAIAPHIVSKLTDSPVIVIDEKGKFVIPILSGHVGGANELASLIAEKIGSELAITTATDINHKFAVDVFAKKNHLSIVNKDGIAKISAKILAGETIRISIEEGHLVNAEYLPEHVTIVSYPPIENADVIINSERKDFDALLYLLPKEYVIGVGCRKGKEFEKIDAFIKRNIKNAGIAENQLFAMASIDLKQQEPGLLTWSRENNIPFFTYTEEELQKIKGDFVESEFVKSKVGIGNVCERAALAAAGDEGKLICRKIAEDGMTISISKREWRVTFDET